MVVSVYLFQFMFCGHRSSERGVTRFWKELSGGSCTPLIFGFLTHLTPFQSCVLILSLVFSFSQVFSSRASFSVLISPRATFWGSHWFGFSYLSTSFDNSQNKVAYQFTSLFNRFLEHCGAPWPVGILCHSLFGTTQLQLGLAPFWRFSWPFPSCYLVTCCVFISWSVLCLFALLLAAIWVCVDLLGFALISGRHCKGWLGYPIPCHFLSD